jgi:hypothetical protein
MRIGPRRPAFQLSPDPAELRHFRLKFASKKTQKTLVKNFTIRQFHPHFRH